MPDVDDQVPKLFHEDVPPPERGSFLKGSSSYDWGMQNRLARIFDPTCGRTVMLAIDHGYFQGPTTGLERVDLSILPLIDDADALMCTRGILRSVVPPERNPAVVHAGQRRALDPQRALRRGDRTRPRGRGADERLRASRSRSSSAASTRRVRSTT